MDPVESSLAAGAEVGRWSGEATGFAFDVDGERAVRPVHEQSASVQANMIATSEIWRNAKAAPAFRMFSDGTAKFTS